MIDLWKNIIFESSLTEKVLEYYENKKKEKKLEKEQESEKNKK